MEYIGVLLDDIVYRGIPYGKTGTENILFYEEAARFHGLTPCFFRLKDITPDSEDVTAYVKDQENQYKKIKVPLPKVIHNRGLYFSNKHKLTLENLVKKGFIIFNQWNRYKKLEVNQILKKHGELTPNIPETHKATIDSIWIMLDKYSELILKPDSGSLGSGLMKVERYHHGNELIYYKKDSLTKIPFTENLPDALMNQISPGNYIVQEYIPLITYKDNPFDIRVSCQKNYSGKWQVTGIVGKVAKNDSFITNVAKGGTVYQLDELLKDTVFDEKKIIERIEAVSLKISTILEEHFTGLADIGLDLGITADGTIKFIECNGRDLRYSFRNAKMHNTWKNTYANPIGYGKYLMDNRR